MEIGIERIYYLTFSKIVKTLKYAEKIISIENSKLRRRTEVFVS